MCMYMDMCMYLRDGTAYIFWHSTYVTSTTSRMLATILVHGAGVVPKLA